ncbi:MAG: hypothetical protein IJC17_03930 [Clostridia bacterium]|nr:hypothetical protein [Clostridia bacterium]
MKNNSDVVLLISSCDLYEDAWNPFFRLLEANWPDCPETIYLLTETKTYVDSYFKVKCIHSTERYWSDRMMAALEDVKEKYLWFFLEDFFLEEKVNNEIAEAAVNCIKNNSDVGVIRFIPEISARWYTDAVIERYFSPIPKDFPQRSNLMLALYNKDYFKRMLRSKETPWDFEKFGKHRSRIYKDEVLIQTVDYPLAFPYNYSIAKEIGISQRKWMRKTKELFDRYHLSVDYENLGWYEKPKWNGKTRKEKWMLLFEDSAVFWGLIKSRITDRTHTVAHFFRNIKDYL